MEPAEIKVRYMMDIYDGADWTEMDIFFDWTLKLCAGLADAWDLGSAVPT
jgi:hypothetical protein